MKTMDYQKYKYNNKNNNYEKSKTNFIWLCKFTIYENRYLLFMYVFIFKPFTFDIVRLQF